MNKIINTALGAVLVGTLGFISGNVETVYAAPAATAGAVINTALYNAVTYGASCGELCGTKVGSNFNAYIIYNRGIIISSPFLVSTGKTIGGSVVVSQIPAGELVTLQLAVWDATYEASNHSDGYYGISEPFLYQTGSEDGSVIADEYLVFEPFTVEAVTDPSATLNMISYNAVTYGASCGELNGTKIGSDFTGMLIYNGDVIIMEPFAVSSKGEPTGKIKGGFYYVVPHVIPAGEWVTLQVAAADATYQASNGSDGYYGISEPFWYRTGSEDGSVTADEYLMFDSFTVEKVGVPLVTILPKSCTVRKGNLVTFSVDHRPTVTTEWDGWNQMAVFDGYGCLQGWTEQLLDVTKPITMETWVYLDPESETGVKGLISYGDVVKLGINNWNQLEFTMYGIEDVVSSIELYPGSGWVHVAAVWTPGVGVQFYLDGYDWETVETTNMPYAPVNWIIDGKDVYRVVVGGEPYGDHYPLQGMMDRVRVHQGVLNEWDLDSDPCELKPLWDKTLFAFDFDMEASMPYWSSTSPEMELNEEPCILTILDEEPSKYQWYKDGKAISGATSATYTITNVKSEDAGSYTVKVSGSINSAASSTSVLSVIEASSIQINGPDSMNVGSGAIYTCTVNYSDGTTETGLPIWSISSGGNYADITSEGVLTGKAAGTVTVKAVLGDKSSTKRVSVANTSGEKPSITTQPKSQTVNEGSAVTFSVVATDAVSHGDFSMPFPGHVSLDMVWIDPGTFLMGSPAYEVGSAYDEVQHEVTLTQGYWLGKYEVTQTQYEAVMGTNPSWFIGADLPVEWVTWYDAMEFCAKLTVIEKAAGRLPEGYEYTLPTEAQWEYACRAGTTTALNSGMNLTGVYECSEMDKVGWYDYNSNGTTHPAGQKQPNTWGLYDMHGNVYEWCLDWRGSYPTSTVTDPTGADTGSYRVMRGGSWGSPANGCRSADRGCDAPGGSNFNRYYGFRVALSPVQSKSGSFLSYAEQKGEVLPAADTLTYQWYKDGKAINGATSSSYTIKSAQKSDEGRYTVKVSNSAGSVTSSEAILQ